MSMKASDWIKQLEATTKRLEKEAILKQAYQAGCQELFDGFKMAYDRHLIFHIKKVPMLEVEDDDLMETPFKWADFVKLSTQLSNRDITGNAARDAVSAAALSCDADQWNYFYRRILIKDMRCGVTETTFNKVLETLGKKAQKSQVKKFEIMLATGVKEGAHKELKGQWLADTKMDGARLVFVLNKKKNQVTAFTRSGKVNKNFAAIEASLHKLMMALPGGIVLDGEIMAADNQFKTLSTQMNRKDSLNTDDFYLAVFDVLPLEDFESQTHKHTQQQRHQVLLELAALFQEHCGTTVRVLPKKIVDLDTAEGHTQLEEMFSMAIDEGFEGIMLKKPDALYEHKRSKSWLKIKPYVDVTVKIESLHEGTGRNENRLGFARCVGEDFDPKDGENKKIEVDVGGGWSDEERDEIFANAKKYVGRLIEVRAMEFTQDRNGGDVWALRHPRFKGFRDAASNKGKKI
jgi:DNA ligase-1